MKRVLVNSDKYNGQYVALVSADDNTVVGSGTTSAEALKQAHNQGAQEPFILYVSDKDLVHI